MPNKRRLILLIAAAALLGALPAFFAAAPVNGQVGNLAQPVPPPGLGGNFQIQPIRPDDKLQGKQPDYKPGTKFSAIKLVEDEVFQKNVDQALDAIEGGDWQDACDFLQEILNSKRDVFARVEVVDPATGAKKSHMISVKFQANNLLAKFPPEGLNAYELKFGAQAKNLLEQAKKSGSRDTLAEVATRFRHTKAGTEANELLATSFLDRGDYFPAALRYERILGPDPSARRISDLTLFKAVLAFKRAGEQYGDKAKDLEGLLVSRLKSNGGLRLANDKVVSIKQVQAILSEGVKVADINPHDWPMVGGTLSRSAQAVGSPPMLDYVLWSRATFMDKSEETGETEPGREAKPLFDKQLETFRNKPNTAIIPGGHPIAVNGILFYRTYAGITGVYLRDVLDKDGKVEAPAGSVHWRSTPFGGALGPIFDDAGMKVSLTNWSTTYVQHELGYVLFENSTVGTLTTDNRLIYAVDDLALPIPPNYLPPSNFWQNPTIVHDNLKPLVMQNRLRAFNIASGKIEWELGGDSAKADEFSNSHFLCAPISVGGKLYVLNEKNNGELRVICLEPQTGKVIGSPQSLGTVKNEHGYFHDIARRVNAIHLAYAEGVLVCPTNAGEILGVDLLSQSLGWAYKYREKPPNPTSGVRQPGYPQMNAPLALSYDNWKATPPVIVNGKVVFTAPDSNAVCCISLRDGSEIWTSPRQENDLFLAGVFLDKVVIVGKNSVRALRLTDGTQVGPALLTSDIPSGNGVASKNIYYLPLKKGEVCSIDMEHWAIKAHNRASKTGGEPPGNLIFYEGTVISQTPNAVIAYPQLLAKLEEAETAYTKDPSPKNLLMRGEMRLGDGQVQKAANDLLELLAKDPPAEIVPRAKDRLFEALGDLLQTDFNGAAPKYLEKYKELTEAGKTSTERQKRLAKYWRLVGQGREDQGNLVEAFLAFKEFGASPLFSDAGIPSAEDPATKVPANLWLRGRISAMFAKAKPEQRNALENKIAEEWLIVKKKNDLAAIRQFTGMFDVPVAVGREARLELANAVIRENSKESFLEAELNLEQLLVPAFRKDPQVGGKALEALARLELAKGTEESLRQAAVYYREINKEFPKAVLNDGKTGADLFQALAEDPRLRPFLEEPSNPWANGEIKHRELRDKDLEGIRAIQGFVFQPEGELTDAMRQHRLVLDYNIQNNPVIRFVDALNNKERWSAPLGTSVINHQFFSYLYEQTNLPTGSHPQAKFRFYQVKGHVAVVQVGLTAYGLDLDAGKVLWQHVLYDPNKVQNFGWTLAVDEQGRMWVAHTQPGQQIKSRVGQIASVQGTYVALVTQKGLVVLDPVKGTLLWSKPGLPASTEAFGDDQHIFYVETSDGRVIGAGQCLRASDGQPVEIPDFAPFYRNQQRIFEGRQILTAEPAGKSVTMRLYDVRSGNSLWKRTFENDPAVLQTEDAEQCGIIERDTGKLIVLNARTGKEIVTANMRQLRIEAEDIKGLERPLFLDDGEKFYVALNSSHARPKVFNSNVSSNFSSGTRCLPVNGWFCCVDRKGELLWYASDRISNQMIVTEQFRSLPILLFSSRYLEQLNTGGVHFVTQSGSLNKANGKWNWRLDSAASSKAQFQAFNIDLRAGTINMIGNFNNRLVVHQHYVEEKR